MVRSYVQDRYVDPITEQQLLEGAIRGLVEATGDKYSTYFSQKAYTEFLQELRDQLSGIGVQVEYKDNYVTIVAPMKDTPGARAGLRSGDRIVAVNGKDVTGLNFEEVVSMIRGPAGTPVRLTIDRNREILHVSLVRAKIPVPQIEWRMLETNPRVGYIHLIQFNEGIGERTRAALDALRAQGMQGLILDLRQNPGGFLHEAVAVASLFVPEGPVVHVVSRTGARETHNSKGRGFDLPLVVLVDEGSASASEVVAGAIKDRGAGVLVGGRTFGKASVQTFFELPDGSGLKLTTARYLTAGGYSINQKGIEPNIAVPAPADLKLSLDDPNHPQMRKALEVLRTRMSH